MGTRLDEPKFIISGKKIRNVLKERWKLFIIILCASIIISILFSIINVFKTTTVDRKYFESTAKIYIDWDESIRDLYTELQNNSTSVQSWHAYVESYQSYTSILYEEWEKTRINSVINDCSNFLSSNTIYNRINQVLLDNGYEIQNGCDIIKIQSTGTSHLLTITVTGYGNKDRIQFLSEKVPQIFIEEGQNKLGLTDCRIIDEPSVYQVYKEVVDGLVKYKRVLEYPDNSIISVVTSENQANNFLKFDNILIVVVGIVLGIAVIMILIVFDKRIYDIVDMSLISKLIYIDTVKLNEKDNINIIETTFIARCKKDNIHSVLITTVKKIHNSKLNDIFLNNDIIDYKEDILCDIDTINTVIEMDKVVLMVCIGKDNIHEVQNALNRLDILGCDVLGYMLCEY